MITLRDTAAMQSAVKHSLPPPIARIIEQRMATFAEYVDSDLSEVVHFVVVEPGDPLSQIEEELGFSPLCNGLDGTRFGEPDFTPTFEWVRDHGFAFELVWVLSDDGFGKILLVPDDPGVEFDLHMLCLEYAHRPIA